MKKFFSKILCISMISFYFLKVEKVQSIVPFYYFPTVNNLQKEGLTIAKNAYQLLYFGQYNQSLNLAKLAEASTSTGKGGYGQLYNDLVMDVGFNLRSSEQGLETAKIMYDSAVDRKSEFSGVDLDTEAARLLEQQQAYQALAKVLSTAKEMVDTLLRFM